MSHHGIFCIETGRWSDILKHRQSIEPALGLLNAVDEVPFFHRNASTAGEFLHYLEQWKNEGHQAYPILYLCFHGAPDVICFSDRDLTLGDLESALEEKCSDRVLYFSSCQTFKLDEERLRSFLLRTHALAVGGYRKSVDWMESAAFELLFLSSLCTSRRLDSSAARRVKERMERRHSQLARNLEFRFIINAEGTRRPRTIPKSASASRGRYRACLLRWHPV